MIAAPSALPPPGRWRVLGQDVLTAVCGYYEVPRRAVLGPSRDPLLVEARRVVIRLLLELDMNLEQIAYTTGRDRTTVGYHIGRYASERGRRPSRDEEAMLAAVRAEMRERGEWPAWAA